MPYFVAKYFLTDKTGLPIVQPLQKQFITKKMAMPDLKLDK
jgi:hypothetical protein